MIRTLALGACLAVGAGAAVWAVFLRDQAPERPIQEEIGGLVWERTIGRAVTKAEESGKPLLVVFRCPP